MKQPKLRELKEAVRAVFSRSYTTRYPFEPHTPPESFRGRPQFSGDGCVGCTACREVCPALAISIRDDRTADPPQRTITLHYDKCIFCGQCELNCTTGDGIRLSSDYDMSTVDRGECVESTDHEIVLCEVCGAVVGSRRHLAWIRQRLGAKAYANPTLLLTSNGDSDAAPPGPRLREPVLARNDLMRVTCPDCRRTLVVRELWGE